MPLVEEGCCLRLVGLSILVHALKLHSEKWCWARKKMVM